jgi:outer membrane protein
LFCRYLAVQNVSEMKNLPIVLNIVVIAALGYLYYYNFSGNKAGKTAPNSANMVKPGEAGLNQPRIAYVELDSLNENIVYFKQKRKELEQQQKGIEAEITNDYKALEAKQNNFIQKNPNASPEDIQNIRVQLAQGQQDIETKKQTQTQMLNQKSFELMESIQKKLKEFLEAYNKEKKYQYILTTGGGMDYIILKDSTLDITKDVIKGMNEKLKPTGNK